MEVKTEANADCMIVEYPDGDKWPTVGMLLHSVICLWHFMFFFHLFTLRLFEFVLVWQRGSVGENTIGSIR